MLATAGDKNHVRVCRYWSVTWTVFAIQSSISGWFSLAYPDVTVTLSFCFCRGGGVNGSQSIYIKDACLSVCLSVCLFVCLFGFGAQTTGWIPTKLGMDLPLDPVGNLEILFWVEPPPPRGGGYNFGKTQKNPNFSIWPRTERDPFAAPFATPFAQIFWVFFGGGEFRYFFEWDERSEASQRVCQPTGAKQPAPS